MQGRICICIFAMMVLLLCGCKEQVPDSEYTSYALLPGVLECKTLQVNSGNYGRSQHIETNGDFAEVESGYYRITDNLLYYADKADLSNWVLVCASPDCAHTETSGCTAVVYSGLIIKDNRLFFLTPTSAGVHLYPKGVELGGSLLCSMAPNGTDIHLEHVNEDAFITDGGSCCWCFADDSYIGGIARLETDGSKTAQIWYVDQDGPRVLLEKPYEDPLYVTVMSTITLYGVRGDDNFMTGLIDGQLDAWFCWLRNGEMVITDRNSLPYIYNTYFSGTTLRGFISNDGYYDYDLITGERIKLVDAQLENSGAVILQPNCIFESTLINSFDSHVEEAAEQISDHSLRFFDGSQWHDVQIPEEILELVPSANLVPRGVFTDCVLFSVAQGNGKVMLYQMSLGKTSYELQACGSYTQP